MMYEWVRSILWLKPVKEKELHLKTSDIISLSSDFKLQGQPALRHSAMINGG